MKIYFVSFLCDELLSFRLSFVPPVAPNPGDATDSGVDWSISVA